MCASLFMRPTDWWDASLFLEAPRCYFFLGTGRSYQSLPKASEVQRAEARRRVVSVGQSAWRCSVETASERAARVSPCRIGLSSGDIGAAFGSALHHLQKARANILMFVRVRFQTFLPNVAVLHEPGTVRNAGFLQQFLKVLLFLFLPHVTFLFSGRRRRMCLRTCVCVCVCLK